MGCWLKWREDVLGFPLYTGPGKIDLIGLLGSRLEQFITDKTIQYKVSLGFLL
jgi:hypothetical protein